MARGRSIRDLFVRIGIDADDAPLRQIDRGVDSLKSNLRTLVIGFTAVSAVIGGVVREAAKFEQTKIAFEVALKSAEKAKLLFEELFDLIVKTPFRMPEVIRSAQQLIAMGVAVSDVTELLSEIGDVSAGVNASLQNVADVFGRIKSQGFATGVELRRFRENSIPIFEELEKITGKNVQGIIKMAETYQLTFPIMRQALRNMTSENGRFFNLMTRQSKTAIGIFSNIQDAIQLTAIFIGEGLLPQIKKLENTILKFLETSKKVIIEKGKKIFMELGRGMLFALKITKDFISTLVNLTQIFGGLENAIKLATAALFIMFSVSMLSGLGNIAIGLFKVATAFTAIGNASAIAQVKAFAFPLLVGTALLALGLIIDDIVSAFQGKRNIILETFEKDYPRAFRKAKRDLEDFLATMNKFIDTAKEGLLTPVNLVKSGISLATTPTGKGKLSPIQSLSTAFSQGLSALSNFELTRIPPGEGAGGGFVGGKAFRFPETRITVGDINVTTQPGADAEEIADTIKNVVRGDLFFPASRATRPSETQ